MKFDSHHITVVLVLLLLVLVLVLLLVVTLLVSLLYNIVALLSVSIPNKTKVKSSVLALKQIR